MSTLQNWLSAFRLRTLPLAVSGLILGNSIAYNHGNFSVSLAVFSCLTALLLQVLSNLANDLGDYDNGADNDKRIGPKRMVQSGAISRAQMLTATIILSVISFLSGVFTLWLAKENVNIWALIGFVTLGLICIWAAIQYTATKNPYGYKGLGDIAVFIFFGLVAVLGPIFLQTGKIENIFLLPSIAFGLFATGVLNLNNMRDIETDAASGKRTVATYLQLPKAKYYHYTLIIIGILLFLSYSFLVNGLTLHLLWLLPIIILTIHLLKVAKVSKLVDFNPLLKQLALASSALAICQSLNLIFIK